MKEQITLDRKDVEDLIEIFEQRIIDKEVLAFPKTEDEETMLCLLRNKLAGRIE